MDKNVKALTCIGCPMGCRIEVELVAGEVNAVRGNTCVRGAIYARREVTHPTRTVTGTVRVAGGHPATLAVKTVPEVPKEKVFAVAAAMAQVLAVPPIAAGTPVLRNVAGTDCDLMATQSI